MACIVSLKPHTVELAVDAHGRLIRGQELRPYTLSLKVYTK